MCLDRGRLQRNWIVMTPADSPAEQDPQFQVFKALESGACLGRVALPDHCPSSIWQSHHGLPPGEW